MTSRRGDVRRQAIPSLPARPLPVSPVPQTNLDADRRPIRAGFQEFPTMETFETKVFRKLCRMSPRVKRQFDEARKALRAERVATPPGPGNLRSLKAQADRDAMHQTFESLSDPNRAEDAKLYDHLFKKEHGDVAVKAGA